VEYAYVDYGVGSSLEEIPRATYEERGYTPPFDQLPTKARVPLQNTNMKPRRITN